MSGELITARRRKSDGKLVRVHPDGREKPFADTKPLPGRTEALGDPENPPLTPERMARMKRVPQVKVIRRALALTQEEFAARYRIPLGTLRDWEQGRAEPDQAACAYLTVIAREPGTVRDALIPPRS